jgi:hypothetical protein
MFFVDFSSCTGAECSAPGEHCPLDEFPSRLLFCSAFICRIGNKVVDGLHDQHGAERQYWSDSFEDLLPVQVDERKAAFSSRLALSWVPVVSELVFFFNSSALSMDSMECRSVNSMLTRASLFTFFSLADLPRFRTNGVWEIELIHSCFVLC